MKIKVLTIGNEVVSNLDVMTNENPVLPPHNVQSSLGDLEKALEFMIKMGGVSDYEFVIEKLKEFNDALLEAKSKQWFLEVEDEKNDFLPPMPIDKELNAPLWQTELDRAYVLANKAYREHDPNYTKLRDNYFRLREKTLTPEQIQKQEMEHFSGISEEINNLKWNK